MSLPKPKDTNLPRVIAVVHHGKIAHRLPSPRVRHRVTRAETAAPPLPCNAITPPRARDTAAVTRSAPRCVGAPYRCSIARWQRTDPPTRGNIDADGQWLL